MERQNGLICLLVVCLLVSIQWGCGSDTGSDDAEGDAAPELEPDNTAIEEVEGDASAQTGLELAGSFDDSFGGHHEISAKLWAQGGFGNPSFFHVSQFSNEDRFAIAHNNVHNAFGGDAWSRFDWTQFDDGTGAATWYCQTAFDAASEDAAVATPAADATDPANSGCGGFAWSKLTPTDTALLLSGQWVDPFGTNHSISAASWAQSVEGSPEFDYSFSISQFSLVGMWLIAQNDATNPTGAGKWSRMDWTWFDAGLGLELWYCQTAFEAETEEAAVSTPPADAADPATTGCGGFSWSRLTPFVE